MSTTAQIVIDRPQPGDLDDLTALFAEMELFYEADRAIDDVTVRERIVAAVFDRPAIDCRLARIGPAPAGFIVFSEVFPATDLTLSLQVKDIFVAQAFRRHGVARKLVAAVARHAIENGHTRIEWTTDPNNNAARAAYDAMGVPEIAKITYRAEGDVLARLADNAE